MHLLGQCKTVNIRLHVTTDSPIPSQGGPPFNRPSAVVFNGADEIFVKDAIQIQKFSAQGKFLLAFGKEHLKHPYGKSAHNPFHTLYFKTLRHEQKADISQTFFSQSQCVKNFMWSLFRQICVWCWYLWCGKLTCLGFILRISFLR